MVAAGFSYVRIIQSRKFPSIPSLLRVFIMKGYCPMVFLHLLRRSCDFIFYSIIILFMIYYSIQKISSHTCYMAGYFTDSPCILILYLETNTLLDDESSVKSTSYNILLQNVFFSNMDRTDYKLIIFIINKSDFIH